MLTKTLNASDDVKRVLRTVTITPSAGFFILKIEGQLDRKTYADTNKFLEAMSGKWNRAKGGHLFETDPTEQIAGILDDGTLTVAKDGFYPTPPDIVARMIALADLRRDMVVLEPSAGDGAIAEALGYTIGDCAHVDVIELNPVRRGLLLHSGFRVIGDDFMQTAPPIQGTYERIIMNPPFEDGQDVKHVTRAFDWLRGGGLLVAIMSAGIEFRNDRLYEDFRTQILSVYGYFERLPEDSFKSSGTTVNSCIVVLQKPD